MGRLNNLCIVIRGGQKDSIDVIKGLQKVKIYYNI